MSDNWGNDMQGVVAYLLLSWPPQMVVRPMAQPPDPADTAAFMIEAPPTQHLRDNTLDV